MTLRFALGRGTKMQNNVLNQIKNLPRVLCLEQP